MRRRRYLELSGAGLTLVFAGCSGSEAEADPVEGQITGGGEQSEGDRSGEGTGGADDDVDEQDTASENVSAAVGQLVAGDTMNLVVEGFERGVDLGEFQEPGSGNEFAVASIALKNTSDEYTTVSNLLQTRIRDDEDYQYDQTFAAAEGATFNDGQFAPGEVERGGIPFELPQSATGLTLVFDFDVSIFGGIDRAMIDLESRADQVHELVQDLAIDVYEPGEAVEYGDVEVGLNEVRTESDLGQFAEPAAGTEFLIVDIDITNDTGEEQRFSTALQMMLKDGQGYTYQEELMATAQLDRAFDEGAPISDGETRRGELVYQVAEGTSPLYWVFEFDLFATGNKTFWQVQ